MANIVICYKWVIDEQDIRINPIDINVDISKAKYKISDYDKNAIEAALKVGETVGDTVVALTFGNSKSKQSLKDALSRGPALAYWINDEGAGNAEGYVTSNVLAAAIKKIGNYRMIICGEGAADTYARQVGPRIGQLLDIPVISSVISIRIDGNRIEAVRKLDNCLEKVSAELPVVVTVLPEIYPAPIPGLKSILDAGKKTINELTISDLVLETDDTLPRIKIKGARGYTANRKNIILKEANVYENVKELISNLKKEGIL